MKVNYIIIITLSVALLIAAFFIGRMSVKVTHVDPIYVNNQKIDTLKDEIKELDIISDSPNVIHDLRTRDSLRELYNPR